MNKKFYNDISEGKASLGIELGSTVIKSILISSDFEIIESGAFAWENRFEDNLWTYHLEDALEGLSKSYQDLASKVTKEYGISLRKLANIGISAMMHGIVALDKDDKQITPFLTWRNTNTAPAASELSSKFNFNIPLRWTVSQLYQAHLDKKEYLKDLAYVTTLAGYIHYQLTGNKVIGIDDASGMFPIDMNTKSYDAKKIEIFNELIAGNYNWKVEDVLPKVLVAGANAGRLTNKGSKLLDKTGSLEIGIPFAAPEGDAATGMIATNSIKAGTGNISMGTSSFLMVTLDKPLSKPYKDVDIVSTPNGLDVAMLHSNNGSTELNDWVNIFNEYSKLCGINEDIGNVYKRLFENSLTANPNVEGVISYNLLANEPIINADKAVPLTLKEATGKLTLANLIRSELYATVAPIAVSYDILRSENVKLDILNAHGGLFKTEGVMQRYLSAALNTKVKVSKEASLGGAYGMAVLASYLNYSDKYSLGEFLDEMVFKKSSGNILMASPEEVKGFNEYLEKYKKYLYLERN